MNVLNRFRYIAYAEGISYLFLLFIAMPFKYFADMPLLVKYGGWAHGLLFVLYIALLLQVWAKYRWGFWKVTLLFLASLIPFASFYVEARLKKEAATLATT